MRRLVQLCALAFASCALTFTVSAADMTQCREPCMLVFDASASMAVNEENTSPPTRIDRVRAALRQVLPTLDASRDVGLVAYGPGRNRDPCSNLEVVFAPKPNGGQDAMAHIDALRPAGRTPLTRAVRQASETFNNADEPSVIVLLTDGEETCGGDPCRLARELRATKPKLTVHVIGYRMQMGYPGRPEPRVACLATTMGGQYATVETTDELRAALEQTLGCSRISHRHGGAGNEPRTLVEAAADKSSR